MTLGAAIGILLLTVAGIFYVGGQLWKHRKGYGTGAVVVLLVILTLAFLCYLVAAILLLQSL